MILEKYYWRNHRWFLKTIVLKILPWWFLKNIFFKKWTLVAWSLKRYCLNIHLKNLVFLPRIIVILILKKNWNPSSDHKPQGSYFFLAINSHPDLLLRSKSFFFLFSIFHTCTHMCMCFYVRVCACAFHQLQVHRKFILHLSTACVRSFIRSPLTIIVPTHTHTRSSTSSYFYTNTKVFVLSSYIFRCVHFVWFA